MTEKDHLGVDNRTQEELNADINAAVDRMSAMIWGYPGIPQTSEMDAWGAGISDPLESPLPSIAKNAEWDAKLRQIEWVRYHFTPAMLAQLYKLSYDADGLRRAACDPIIRKEKPGG